MSELNPYLPASKDPGASKFPDRLEPYFLKFLEQYQLPRDASDETIIPVLAAHLATKNSCSIQEIAA